MACSKSSVTSEPSRKELHPPLGKRLSFSGCQSIHDECEETPGASSWRALCIAHIFCHSSQQTSRIKRVWTQRRTNKANHDMAGCVQIKTKWKKWVEIDFVWSDSGLVPFKLDICKPWTLRTCFTVTTSENDHWFHLFWLKQKLQNIIRLCIDYCIHYCIHFVYIISEHGNLCKVCSYRRTPSLTAFFLCRSENLRRSCSGSQLLKAGEAPPLMGVNSAPDGE